MRATMRSIILLPVFVLLSMELGAAQAQTSQPTKVQPTTAPADDATRDSASARVQKVEGKATYSILQADGAYGPKQPIKTGDLLAPGTRIETGLRARVVLVFGDNTVVMIDRITLASIDQFRKTSDHQQISLGLGHGVVRAGAAETTLRSDMVIQTPTATLSKRGTFGIQLEYEPSTGHFRAALSESGVIAILNRLTNQERTVFPGQHVTDAMARWIDTAKFEHWVPVQDIFGLTPGETRFNAFLNTGPGVSQVGGGSLVNLQAGRDNGNALSTATIEGRAALSTPAVVPAGSVPRLTRTEGNFGAR